MRLCLQKISKAFHRFKQGNLNAVIVNKFGVYYTFSLIKQMNELEILEEDIKRKMKAIADGFCPSHPNIRISKTNMFGFKKTMECSLCSVARQKMIEQISNNGRNSSHNGNEISSVASKLASNSAIQRIYQTDEALANSSAKYVVQYSNGDFYEGGLLDNKRNGIGVWILSNGDRFDGSFYNDKMHGDGTYSYLNGDAYCGTYSQGKKHGKGTYKWANGDTYEATFINGREDGNGVYLWNSNAINVSIDSVEGHQQAVAGNKVAVTGDANVWGKGAEESANQIKEGSIDESWSVGTILNDLVLQERKNDAYMEVLQSAYDATREDSSTDRGSTRHCSPACSAATGFSFNEDANQLEVLAQHGEGSGSGATEGDGGPSDFDPCIEGFSEPPLVLSSVSSDDFYQPCLFDKEVDANEPDQDGDQPPYDLPLGRDGDGLLEQVLPDSCLQMMCKGSDEMKAFFVRECLAGRDVAIEAAIVRIVMELIDERCNENSFVLSETEIASREDSISDNIGTYSTDMILESVDELALDLSGELVVAESEYFVAAAQHISACLLHEEIEFLLHVLVGPRLDGLNSSIDRGFEYASLEMIEDSVRTHLTDIALEDISEREVSIMKGIELAFESLGAETSSEELLPMAQGYLSARDKGIEITTDEVSWLVMLEVVAEEIEMLAESSIKERKKFDSTASQVALEEVGNMLSAEIAVVASTSLSEWENVIAGAIVGVHLRLIDEVVETYSKDFTSEELLSRECAIAGVTILLSNEILATATDKELNEVVVCLAAQRITSMQAAMEYIHEQEILQTVVQYTTEVVSEQLESFDISIKAAEEWIVSAESDALVREALLEVAGFWLDARTLGIESAFLGISADLVSEITTTTMRDTIAQEVAWDFQLWDLYEDVISWVERDACTEVAQAAVSSLEKLLDIIVLDVYDDSVLDCIREVCACEISLESLLHESADFLAVTSIDEVTFQIAEVIAREVLSLRESEYFVAATQQISACLLHEEIEFLLHVLVGPRLDGLNSSIDRGFEYASLEMIEDSVRTHLTDIALEDISEREVSIMKGIELAFESLGAETSSEELLPMAQGYLSARDKGIEITTDEVSWLVMLEVVAEEIEMLAESSIKERKKFDSTASQVALEEVGNMLSAEIAVVASTSLSEWENVIAGAIVGVHLRLIDEVVETYSKDFTSEELLSRECAIAGVTILLSNEILATATDKELNEVVVCLAAQRITSMQAAMEYIHEQEILQTVVQYTTEVVSEQLESFDISIKAAEEWIVSAESDALVREALLEVAGFWLDARTLGIESAFLGISADLVSEITTTTMRDTIAQEVAWDFQLWDLYEDVISWVERDACTEVAQAAVSSLEKLLDIIVLDVYDDSVLDCIREVCACEISLESLLHESADFLAVTSIDEVTFQIAEVIAREVLSLRVEIVLDCAAEFASALTAEVVQESATELSGAVRLAMDNRTLIESFLNEVIKQACTTVLAGTIKALPVYYNANLESSRTNKSGAVDPSNSVMGTDSGPKYVEVVTEGNIIAAAEHDTALERGIGEGTESQTDSIHFHTPQFHSMECMEGEYSAVASEVEFGSCFDGIAGSYTGTITSKPMAVPALGSSESSSVGNYSADAESSFTSVGEDERTLNSEVAEVMSFMKRSCDGNSEYSADGENSEQCLPLHNDDRFYSGYQWSVAEYQHKKDDVDLTEYNQCVSENCNTNEATMGICIRTSSSGDRIMEGVSIDKIYMQESPKERKWMVSPLADGVKEGQLYRSRSQEASDSTTARVAERMQPRSAEGEARKRASSRYSVVQSLNGDVYEGAVSSDGLFNGYGKLKFFNGDFYEGSFLNGYRSGTGMYQYSNGDTYEGSFKNGCKDGKGVYHYKDSGAVYQGSYVNDRRHGNGIYSYPNGGKFIGEYINGKKTAGGIYIHRPVKS